MFIAKSALGGKFTIGHFKPYRSMEELTSSNEITMMERPFASATGLYNGRQFQQGVGYLRGSDQLHLRRHRLQPAQRLGRAQRRRRRGRRA